ncbi:MAG: hypothetical protein HY537_06740 [Deltaproteobacteria bacterium]|nr:hypothetical protein [Deltaproteobacteria bacterium]
MGRVIAFSEFDDYYDEVSRTPGFFNGALIDTNILISLSYEIKNGHEDTVDFFDSITACKTRYFATVNTKAEFIDFHRRLILTENLLDAVDQHSQWRISARARAAIHSNWAAVRARQATQGSDPIFGDLQLKAIKKTFSALKHSGNTGWLTLCSAFIGGKIGEVERLLAVRGVEYLSQHDPICQPLFMRKVDWPDAAAMIEHTGLSVSDAMILNAFQCSRCSFLFSADFDIGYAALSDPAMKDVIMPDAIAREYRHFHFKPS